MVVGDDERAVEFFRLYPRQRRFQIKELRVADVAVGDDAGIFQRVAVKGQDANERRLKGDEHPRLYLRGARESAGFRRHFELSSAEILEKRLERRGLRSWRDHAVVIAGERDNGSRIVAVRLI